jgi:hypothetical protein
MEPRIVKAETKGDAFKGFWETARWDVILGDETIGQVWRGKDSRDRTCWMVCSALLPQSLPQSSVIGGYARTTKAMAIKEVVDWHGNRHRSFRMGEIWLHCSTHREMHGVVSTAYLAEHDDGENLRWIHSKHVLEPKPHMGAQSAVGWYASAQRAGRGLNSYYCADEREAIGLVLDEAFLPPTPEEKRAPIMGYLSSRFYGSLAAEVNCAR